MRRLDDILHNFTHPQTGSLHAAAFVAVDKSGNVIYRGAAGGSESVGDGKTHMDTNSLCWVASFTKLVTSVAIMQLVERGVLDLDQEVRDILPELKKIDILVDFDSDSSNEGGVADQNPVSVPEKVRQPRYQDVRGRLTIRNLLSHTSGFCYDSMSPLLQEWSRFHHRTAHTFCGSVDGYRHPLVFEPGTSWGYGGGLDWAGQIIEHVCQMPLEQYMQNNIWSKIGAKNTTFHPEFYEQSLPTPLQMMHRVGPSLTPGPILLNTPAVDNLGGLGLFSTAEDFGLLLSALIRETEPLLQKQSLDILFSPQLNQITRNALLLGLGKQMKRLLGVTNIEDTSQVDHCLAGPMTLRDIPRRRRKGTVSWAGLPNSHWWVDRKTGIAAAFLTQILPFGDANVTECVIQLEEALYKYIHESVDGKVRTARL